MIDERNWLVRLGVAGVASVALCGLRGPVAAAATTGGTTLEYSCTAGLPMVAHLAWNPPSEIVAGQPVPTITVTAAATIDAADARLLAAAGVASVDGSGDTTVVATPQGTVDARLQLTVSRTQVPATGDMTFHATGALTGLLLRQPGQAVVDVGTALNLTLTPRDGNGKPIISAASVSCTLNPGQSQQAFTFDIASNTPDTAAHAGESSGGKPGATALGVGGAGSSMGGSSTATSVTSSAPVSTTPGSIPARDSAALSDGRQPSVYWWLPLAGTVAVVGGAVGGVRWRRNRRRAAKLTGRGVATMAAAPDS